MITLRGIGSFVAGGVVMQAAAAVAGLVLARTMPVGDYAIYTVATTIMGAITVITRSGIQTGFAAELGKVWPDRAAAAGVLSGALKARLWISALTMPAILLASLYLLARAGAQGWVLWSSLALLLAVWVADLRCGLFDFLLYYDNRPGPVRLLDTVLAILRMVAVLALALAKTVFLLPALLVTLLVTAGRIPLLQRWSRETLGRPPGTPLPPPPPEAARAVTRIARRQVPTDIFFCFQAQFVLYHLTGAGSLELATYGALGRIAQLLVPFAGLSIALCTPAFANTASRVVPRLAGLVLLCAAPGLALIGLAIAAPDLLLLIIGKAYAGQVTPLIASAFTAALTLAVQCAWDLVSHRGWNEWAWLRIPWGVTWALAAPLFLAVDTAAGAYLFTSGFVAGTLAATAMGLGSAQRRGEIALLGPHRSVAAALHG